MQAKNIVAGYLKNNQLPPFGFAMQKNQYQWFRGWIITWKDVLLSLSTIMNSGFLVKAYRSPGCKLKKTKNIEMQKKASI